MDDPYDNWPELESDLAGPETYLTSTAKTDMTSLIRGFFTTE